eukprot:CAMPEP_0171783060 /NCGR_PEP_ID=MMETSP0991-20121206/61251_1 /TAXON_ID=483369 /ORGANISM="non described non described, Strain CCMP2098" /LENGTH=71 /DNA_ID=CAMNT_0012391091 /DNA_START=158 /DNA_END=373 /DNA_ORIENTATION=-
MPSRGGGTGDGGEVSAPTEPLPRLGLLTFPRLEPGTPPFLPPAALTTIVALPGPGALGLWNELVGEISVAI